MTTFKALRKVTAFLVLFVSFAFLSFAASASAAAPAPGWRIDAFASPSNFAVGDSIGECAGGEGTETYCDSYQVTATNAGSAATDGAPVTLTDTPPVGVTVQEVRFFWRRNAAENSEPPGPERITNAEEENNDNLALEDCNGGGHPQPAEQIRCTLPSAVAPDGRLIMVVIATLNQGVSGSLADEASVSGGGAAGVSTSTHNTVSSTPAPFGASAFDFFIDGSNGVHDTQAGDHPYELTTTIDLNNDFRISPVGNLLATSVEDVRDVVVDLPLGFVGSTLAAPQCTFTQLNSIAGCPRDTQVGRLFTEDVKFTHVDSPLYNLVPERGVPAEFAYVDGIGTSHVIYTHVVPTPRGYVLQTSSVFVPQIDLRRVIATFYGEPTVRDHSGGAQIPFFTNPTSCGDGPLVATLYLDSWQHPARVTPGGVPVDLGEEVAGKKVWAEKESVSPPVTGCNALQFTPELGAQPTTHESDKPSGLEFELKLHQSEEAGVPATATLKKVDVTLPEGFTVDPSAGDGLGACSEQQIGWEPGATGQLKFNAAPEQCPESSKIGSLELESPLIPRKLTGELFLAAQNANPFDTTLAAYVVVNDPTTGVLIKIAGEFLPDPSTGRLTALFDENPNLPFSDLKLHFFGGPRAELATPESCGTFTTTTQLTPYSFPDSGSAAEPFDNFLIDEACPGGFSPSFTAGSTNLQAGAYTPFVASFSRSDTDQELQGLTVTLPPGLLANVASVPLCDEADANAGTCPESSQVGTAQTGVGPGSNPLFVGGKAYLTGPYNGGPYGLSVVVPAVAGPFNFGTVVVRQSIRIDPATAQVSDVSDPFPTIIAGIPLRLRRVDVTLSRPGFTFNPTSCAKLGFAGSISGSPLGSPRRLAGNVGYATQPGASASFTTPFQVTNCTSLKFQPKFSVSTSGKTSRSRGASLTAKLSYPNLPQGAEANIARVKVDLPKQLPSRLTTLQKACTAAQFNANPAGCPTASKIGFATVHTPILPGTLSGPAIFVSHGGEAFPSLTMVLQGDNVTVDLVGTTFISKAGITSTTFKTVPDTPFSTFELTLPQGKYSALAANGNLCKSKLAMPTEFLAQNGAKINESTKVTVTGCAKAHKVSKKAKRSKKH
jgi:hypothetical protein